MNKRIICNVEIPENFHVSNESFYDEDSIDDGILSEYLCSLPQDDAEFIECVNKIKEYFNCHSGEKNKYCITYNLICSLDKNSNLSSILSDFFHNILSYFYVIIKKIKKTFALCDEELPLDYLLCDSVSVSNFQLHREIYEFYKNNIGNNGAIDKVLKEKYKALLDSMGINIREYDGCIDGFLFQVYRTTLFNMVSETDYDCVIVDSYCDCMEFLCEIYGLEVSQL